MLKSFFLFDVSMNWIKMISLAQIIKMITR